MYNLSELDLYNDYQVNMASIETQFFLTNDSIHFDSKKFALDKNFEVFLEIFNEPQSNGYRFSSLCEEEEFMGKSTIKGENSVTQFSTLILKNFDKNKLEHEDLIPLVEVELLTSDGEHIHPNQLKAVSKNILTESPILRTINTNPKQNKQSKFKLYYHADDEKYEKYNFDGLMIVNVPKYLVEEELERYYFKLEQSLKKEFKQGAKFYAKTELSKIGELKQARLKFQAVLYNKKSKTIETCISQSVKTHVITDATLKLLQRNEKIEYFTQLAQNIRIIRSSKIVGNINGNEEVFLFTKINGKIELKDFEIEFNQRENNQITWTAKVEPDIIYNDSVIMFRTPNYNRQVVTDKSDNKMKNVKGVDKSKLCEHPAKVLFRLHRISTKEYSTEWTFYFSQSKHSIIDDISISLVNKLNEFLADKTVNIDNNEEKSMETSDDKKGKNDEDIDLDEDDDNITEETINSKDQEEDTIANLETIKNLVEDRKKKMNLLVDRTCTALLDVAQSRSIHKLIKIQRYLLNVKNSDGNTPIHLAILNGHYDLAEIYVDIALTIPHYNIINVKNNLQLTPLLLAAHMEEYDMCSFLLESSASLAEVILADVDLQGDNCFHIAAKKRNINLTKVLVNYVKINLDKSYLMNLCNYEGDTPLHIACKNNSYDVAEEFLFSDLCKINEQNKRTGETPLHYTCSRNFIQLTKLLVKNLTKRNLDIDVQAFNGTTALHMAISNRNYLITRLLIKSNANIFVQSIESIHGNFMKNCKLLSENEEIFYRNFNSRLLKDKQLIPPIKSESAVNSLEDAKKRAENTVGSVINTEKVAVEITDLRSDEQELGGKSIIKRILNEQGLTHCLDSYHYAYKDKILLKLIGTLNSDLYMPKDEINIIMDCELRKKLENKFNFKQYKITSNIKNSQVDFIEAIENQMKNLNKDFKLKMKIMNNENEKINNLKRRTDNSFSKDDDRNEDRNNIDFKRTRIKEME